MQNPEMTKKTTTAAGAGNQVADAARPVDARHQGKDADVSEQHPQRADEPNAVEARDVSRLSGSGWIERSWFHYAGEHARLAAKSLVRAHDASLPPQVE